MNAQQQQIANLNNQVASDQSSITSAQSSAKNWEYIGIGVLALIGVAVLIYFFKALKIK